MPLWCQEWKGLTVQKGTRGLWQGLTEVNATSTIHSDLRNWLISFSSKGAQEIPSYSLAKVNYTNIPWRNSHMPCAVQTRWALCPTGRDLTALTASRLPHHPKGFVAQLQGIPSFLHEVYCLTFISHWNKKLSIVISCDKGKQQIKPTGSRRKVHFTVNCCVKNLSECKIHLHRELFWEKQRNRALWLFQDTELV